MRLTKKETHEIEARIMRLGFDYDEMKALRRISHTLSRWDEAECNGEIERESSGKPFRVVRYYNYPAKADRVARIAIKDLENGAIKRLEGILDKFYDLNYYRQTDPRGASLYIYSVDKLQPGQDIDSVYSSIGTAIY